MKKFFIEALSISVVAGFFIRFFSLIILGKEILSQPEGYLISILISVASCSLVFFVHVKIFTNQRYHFIIKLIITYVLILGIYCSVNLVFGGIGVFQEPILYTVGLMIIIVTLPFVIYLNKQICTYHYYLNLKKKKYK